MTVSVVVENEVEMMVEDSSSSASYSSSSSSSLLSKNNQKLQTLGNATELDVQLNNNFHSLKKFPELNLEALNKLMLNDRALYNRYNYQSF